MQSHIVLPTFSSCATTARSGSSSRRTGSSRKPKSKVGLNQKKQDPLENGQQAVQDQKQQQQQQQPLEKLIPSPVKQIKAKSPVKYQQQPAAQQKSPLKQQQQQHALQQSPLKQKQAQKASPTKQKHKSPTKDKLANNKPPK